MKLSTDLSLWNSCLAISRDRTPNFFNSFLGKLIIFSKLFSTEAVSFGLKLKPFFFDIKASLIFPQWSLINKGFDIHKASTIDKGQGWLIKRQNNVIAFALRYPNKRIALLYCKGDSQRKGYGTRLIHKLEQEAKKEGLPFLSTEASLISYKLFLRNKWQIIRKEKIIIKNIIFERYKMIKIF